MTTPWLCCGCGAPSKKTERTCDCATDVLYRRTERNTEYAIKDRGKHEIALEEIERLASRNGPPDTIDALRQIQARAKRALAEKD